MTAALGTLCLGRTKALTATLEKVLAAITTDRAHADHICRLCDLAACPEKACPVELAALASLIQHVTRGRDPRNGRVGPGGDPVMTATHVTGQPGH